MQHMKDIRMTCSSHVTRKCDAVIMKGKCYVIHDRVIIERADSDIKCDRVFMKGTSR
jgi:hypothetical protein